MTGIKGYRGLRLNEGLKKMQIRKVVGLKRQKCTGGKIIPLPRPSLFFAKCPCKETDSQEGLTGLPR